MCSKDAIIEGVSDFMADNRYVIEGRNFYNKTDYEAGLRDAKKIKEIKDSYDLSKKEDIQKVYQLLTSGSCRFESVIGDEFDDKIYRLYSEAKAKPLEQTNGKKKVKVKAGPKKKTVSKVSLEDMDETLKEAVQKEIRRQEKKRRILIAVFSLVAVGCFVFFGYDYYQTYRMGNDMKHLSEIKENNRTPGLAFTMDKEEQSQKDDEKEPEVLNDYKTLLNMNKDLIGWLKIADINIDYPVMQTSDNTYYLEHDFDKNYNKNGCLFLDYKCDVINRNKNLIIYGHNMRSGQMFGSLDKYASEDYYKEHPKFEFDTIYEKGAYEIVYVFRSRIYNEDDVVFKYYQFLDVQSELEFDSNMSEMAAISLYDTGITPTYEDELLTLSTCDYQEDNGRFVVVARKIN